MHACFMRALASRQRCVPPTYIARLVRASSPTEGGSRLSTLGRKAGAGERTAAYPCMGVPGSVGRYPPAVRAACLWSCVHRRFFSFARQQPCTDAPNHANHACARNLYVYTVRISTQFVLQMIQYIEDFVMCYKKSGLPSIHGSPARETLLR